MRAIERTWRRLAAITLCATFARVCSFGNPVIHVDEEFYFVTARAMWDGALPFVDIWDRKPIGLFLLYMPAAALPLPWATWAYQAMALTSLVATAWLITILAERAGWATGATLGGIAYVLWPDLINGVGGQAPILYNLPMAAAALLIVVGDGHRHRRAFGIAAMALVGAALQIKYSAVFEGVFFGLWLLGQEWRSRRSIVAIGWYGAVLVAIALAPTLLAFAAYAAMGHADALMFANFQSVLHRNPDPPGEMLGNVGTLVLLLSPLVAMAAGARHAATGGDPLMRRFLAAWLVVAIGGLSVFPPWFDHYGLPVLVPATACAAGFFGQRRWRRVGPAILVLAAIAGQITVVVNRVNRGNAADFARLARAVGTGPGCLYVYSGSTPLYPATGRCRVSRYVVPSHLNRVREEGATGVDQVAEVRRILAGRPAVIVMRPPFRGERPDIRAIVLATVRHDYRLAAVTPMGREAISVYKRD